MDKHFATALSAVFGAILLAGSATAAPDQTQGVALLAATVASDGTLVRSVGAVAAEPILTGAFRVRFNRPVAGCAVQVSLREDTEDDDAGIKENGVAIAGTASLKPDTVVVTTRERDGTLDDKTFDLLVFCAR